MQPGLYKGDNNTSDDDKLFSDGLFSIIENDYILNFLNDIDSLPKRLLNRKYIEYHKHNIRLIPSYQFFPQNEQNIHSQDQLIIK